MKTILVLGGGVYQLPLINKAKSLGHNIIVASVPGNYPGLKAADEIINIDTKDSKKLISLLQSKNIDAAITAGTDVAIPTLGMINDHFNLFGINHIGAMNATDKICMKKLFVKYNIPTANFLEIDNYDDGLDFINKIGFPVMVKAPNSSGGRGITKVSKQTEFAKAYERAKEITTSKIIIEEFIEGEEFGAQAFIYNNKILYCFPHNDTVTPAPYFTPIGHSFPFKDKKLNSDELVSLTLKICKALELNNCALNFDLIRTGNNEIKIIEVGARLGATCLPELLEASYGIDAYKLVIDTALNNKFTLNINKRIIPSAAELLKAHKTGVLKKISIPEYEKEEFDLSFDYKKGDHVNKFVLGPDRIGHILTRSRTAAKAEAKIKAFIKNIKYQID